MIRQVLGWVVSSVSVIGLIFAMLPVGVTAQESGAITLVASGLANPRGFTWDDKGTLYVALAGTGDSATAVGPAASVVKIENGCPTAVATGLPSTMDPYQDVLGPVAAAFLNGQLYVLQSATSHVKIENPTHPNGIYAVKTDGTLSLVADLTKWILANPVAHVPGDQNPLGEPIAFLADKDAFWVLEANSGEVLRVTLAGEVTRVADLSEGHPVPVGFAAAPDGGVYVGFLTPAPHPDASSKIVKVAPNGTVTEVWTGLTTVTGIAVAKDGTLYALEMATGNTPEKGMLPGTGKVVRQTGAATAEDVVTGLEYPIHLAMGPDGALYIGGPAYGPGALNGAIVRVDLSQKQPMTFDPAVLKTSKCTVIQPPPTVAPTAAPATTLVPADLTPESGKVAVEIKNFAFSPANLSVTVGTTITWTNQDSVAHTATGTSDGSFNSGNLNQNQSFSYTFEKAGSYPYVCLYHASMTGTIEVK